MMLIVTCRFELRVRAAFNVNSGHGTSLMHVLVFDDKANNVHHR